MLDGICKFRDPDIRRLPETKATLLKPEGSAYAEGDIFKQPRLAATLRTASAVASGPKTKTWQATVTAGILLFGAAY